MKGEAVARKKESLVRTLTIHESAYLRLLDVGGLEEVKPVRVEVVKRRKVREGKMFQVPRLLPS